MIPGAEEGFIPTKWKTKRKLLGNSSCEVDWSIGQREKQIKRTHIPNVNSIEQSIKKREEKDVCK